LALTVSEYLIQYFEIFQVNRQLITKYTQFILKLCKLVGRRERSARITGRIYHDPFGGPVNVIASS